MRALNIWHNVARVTRRFRPRGTVRLLHMMHNPDAQTKGVSDFVVAYDGQLLMHIDTSSYIEWSVFFYGYYEPEVLCLTKRLLQPGHVAFDVGANVGCHTLIMGAHVGAAGKVVAVEPPPAVFERLQENIEINRLGHVTPFRCALSDASGQMNLVSYAEGAFNQGTSRLDTTDGGDQDAHSGASANNG